MRVLALLSLLTGCAATAAVDVEAIEASWSGRFEGDDACGSGDVRLALEPAEQGLTGTLRYDTTDDFAGAVHALYAMRGAVEDGVLTLRPAGILEADALPQWRRWCVGALELSHASPERLEGAWVGQDCDCGGTVTLSPSS